MAPRLHKEQTAQSQSSRRAVPPPCLARASLREHGKTWRSINERGGETAR